MALRGRGFSIASGAVGASLVPLALFGALETLNWHSGISDFEWTRPFNLCKVIGSLVIQNNAPQDVQSAMKPFVDIIVVGMGIVGISTGVYQASRVRKARKEIHDNVTKKVDDFITSLKQEYSRAIAAGQEPVGVKERAEKTLKNIPDLAGALKDVKCLSPQEIVRIITAVRKECEDIVNHNPTMPI